MPLKRFSYPLWIAFLVVMAALHAWHLRADFPNFSPWEDWSKYTDEGWYGNAAIRAHLFGNWYIPGDFNPAAALPVWPFLLWIIFFATGVTIQAARGLAVAIFFVNLFLSYKLFRDRGPRWAGLLAVTFLVTSPFLYCFSRLALLEPLLLCLTLSAMNLSVRLSRFRHPEAIGALIGLLFTAMMLTKTTALFLLPALAWTIAQPFWREKERMFRLLAAAGGSAAISFCIWMYLVVSNGLFADYKYLFFINSYKRPHDFYGHVMSAWWAFHGALWADIILIPLSGALVVIAITHTIAHRREPRQIRSERWTAGFWSDPLCTGSVLAAFGYIGFMAYQNHPQPRYFVVVAFFCFIIVARVIAQLSYAHRSLNPLSARNLGLAALTVALATAAFNTLWTIRYAIHPQYTWIAAAQNLTNYIDEHPNGNRILLSISGDEITLITHLPSLCDDFSTIDLPAKIARYQPGWYATWDDLDPDTLEDLHVHDSLEQAGSFPAFDDPDRNMLYLLKMHPLPNGGARDPDKQNLKVQLPDDKFTIDVD
ncbi:ArnT family glycosyltransferase [Acidicapsa dinghuensis]|uniref:ArnT family glycosyltransferase n=1 Tax=Acidicapsa dinghuensis TaxID=2218256 RepID=A0ABW1EAL9_9BACT|nr:glycosyltransferase family 39 protein [Acidicapsa dinghuensis]